MSYMDTNVGTGTTVSDALDSAKVNMSSLVLPGQRVVIKPNLVFDRHPLGRAGTECTITSADVVRQIIKTVLDATGGDAQITVCDVPLQSAHWPALMELGGYDLLMREFPNVEVLDFRRDVAVLDKRGIVTHHIKQRGDPRGYIAVNLGDRSAMVPVEQHSRKLRITDYGAGAVSRHHHPGVHEYLLSRTVMGSDLFINAPKLKTHAKAGITCAMKNLVGINGDKSWIAHHRAGSTASGGDEYETLHILDWLLWYGWDWIKRNTPFAPWIGTLIAPKAGEGSMEGSWKGNDTIWRCVADLNEILLMCDNAGLHHRSQQRNAVTIVDALVCGEGAGPMQCTPRVENTIIVGQNPWCVDLYAASLMGLDWRTIKTLSGSRDHGLFDYARQPLPRLHRNSEPWAMPRGWQGAVNATTGQVPRPPR